MPAISTEALVFPPSTNINMCAHRVKDELINSFLNL